MNEMSLPSRHKIRTSSPGDLRLRTLRSVTVAPHNIESLRMRKAGNNLLTIIYYFIYYLFKYIYTGCIHICKDAIFRICALSYIQYNTFLKYLIF